MLKIIINNQEFQINSFQERYDSISKEQLLTVEKNGVDENFLLEWVSFEEKNPIIESIQILFEDEQPMISYSDYNTLRTVIVQSIPDTPNLNGIVTFSK